MDSNTKTIKNSAGMQKASATHELLGEQNAGVSAPGFTPVSSLPPCPVPGENSQENLILSFLQGPSTIFMKIVMSLYPQKTFCAAPPALPRSTLSGDGQLPLRDRSSAVPQTLLTGIQVLLEA